MSYSLALKINLRLCGLLLNLPNDIHKYIVSFLEKKIYLYNVYFTRKMINSMNSLIIRKFINYRMSHKNIKLIENSSPVAAVINESTNNTNINTNAKPKKIEKSYLNPNVNDNYQLFIKSKNRKLSKNEYENRKKQPYKVVILQKKKEKRLISINKKNNIMLKCNTNNYLNYDNTLDDGDILRKYRYNIDDWEEWSDQGETDEYGAYGDLHERYYRHKIYSELKIFESLKLQNKKYAVQICKLNRSPYDNYLKSLNKIGYYGFEYEKLISTKNK